MIRFRTFRSDRPDLTQRGDGRLPLVIVGGFLGAGKSTWLRHQLHKGRFGRAHVLVNEAAETPVDDLLLSNAERLEVLAGGCACCEGRVALRAALVSICNRQDRGASAAIGRIVLETSGLADPGAIAETIAADAVLSRRLAVEQTIVLLSAVDGLDHLAGELLARRQVEAADMIVVTKSAGEEREFLSRLGATLRLIAPDAKLGWSEFGVPVAVKLDAGALPFRLGNSVGDKEPIRPHRLDLTGAGWVAMSAWLSALLAARGGEIVRVKGAMTTPAGRLLLQSVRWHVQPAEILPPRSTDARPEDDFLVLIGRGIDPERLVLSWRRFVLDEA